MWVLGVIIDALLAYCLPAKGRSKDPLPSLVQLGHDNVLRLVGTGLRREVHQHWFVDILGQLLQQVVLRQGQAGRQGAAQQGCDKETEKGGREGAEWVSESENADIRMKVRRDV